MTHAHDRITHRRLRTAVRAAAVLSATTVVLWLPGAPAGARTGSSTAPAFPPTVIRSTPVPLASMVEASRAAGSGPSAGSAAGASVSPDGTVRATEPLAVAPRVICAPLAFTEVGLSWHQNEPAATPLSADIASATGRAQRFTGAVHMSDDSSSDGPDPGSPEYHPDLHSTEPLWTDTAR